MNVKRSWLSSFVSREPFLPRRCGQTAALPAFLPRPGMSAFILAAVRLLLEVVVVVVVVVAEFHRKRKHVPTGREQVLDMRCQLGIGTPWINQEFLGLIVLLEFLQERHLRLCCGTSDGGSDLGDFVLLLNFVVAMVGYMRHQTPGAVLFYCTALVQISKCSNNAATEFPPYWFHRSNSKQTCRLRSQIVVNSNLSPLLLVSAFVASVSSLFVLFCSVCVGEKVAC